MHAKHQIFAFTLLIAVTTSPLTQAQVPGQPSRPQTPSAQQTRTQTPAGVKKIKAIKNTTGIKLKRALNVAPPNPKWVDAGQCHIRNVHHPAEESYMAKCKPNASRYANVLVNCGGSGGVTLTSVSMGQRSYPTPAAKRFECYNQSDSNRDRIGYDAGQSGTLTGNIAAEYACGCYTPPGGSECGPQGCQGRMQASLIIKKSNIELAQLMSQHGWQAWATQWAALNTSLHNISG